MDNNSTDETGRNNFFSVFGLVNNEGTKALRLEFDRQISHHYVNLSSALNNPKNSQMIKDIYMGRNGKPKLLNDSQYQQLYPKHNHQADSKTFNIQILSFLFRNLLHIRSPVTNTWPNPPGPNDVSLAADISNLMIMRNGLAHVAEVKLDTAQFEDYWNKLEAILTRLNVSQSEIDQWKHLNELKETKVFKMEQTMKLDIKEDINDIEDDSRKNYSKKEKENLVKSCTTKILFVGKKEAGKSSIVKTLKDNRKQKMKEIDRTLVMNHHNWTPDELIVDGNQLAVTIADLGGHPIYKNTAKFFSNNDEKNLIVVTHKITDHDYESCYNWVNDLVYTSHQCKFIIALSQIDLLSEEGKAEVYDKKCSLFKSTMTEMLNQEINRLNKQILTKQNIPSKTELLEKRRDCIERIKEGIDAPCNSSKQCVFLLCCNDKATGVEDDESEGFRNQLIQLCKERFTEIPKLFRLFYKELGKIGLRNSKLVDVSVKQPEDNLLSEDDKINQNVDALHSEFSFDEPVSQNPDTNCGTKEDSGDTMKIPYISISSAKTVYERIRNDVHGNETLKDCLRKLHFLGVLLWYEFSEETEAVIFHDIPAFVNMMRSLFNHKLQDDGLKWENLSDKEQVMFNYREDLYNNGHKDNLLLNGILSKEMLQMLLVKYNFDHYTCNIVNLLCHLRICYELNDNQTFFPWYLDKFNSQSMKQQNDIVKALRWVSKSDKTAFSRTLKIDGHFPSHLFYYLCVAIARKFQLKLKHIWTNGLFLHLGHLAVAVLCNGNSMYGIVKASRYSVRAICDMWKSLQLIHVSLEQIVDREMPGALENSQLVCTTCPGQRNMHFSDFIVGIGKGEESGLLPVKVCGTFEDEITNSCFLRPVTNRENCCDIQNSVLFLPPHPVEKIYEALPDTDEHKFLRDLQKGLATFCDQDPGEFALGSKSYIDLSSIPLKGKSGLTLECRVNLGLMYDSTFTEEHLFETAPAIRKGICYLQWPTPDGKVGIGTGFLLGSMGINSERRFLILTCHHLLPMGLDTTMARYHMGATAKAGFRIDPNSTTRIEVKISHVCLQDEGLDYAVLCLHEDMGLNRHFSEDERLSQLICAERYKPTTHSQLVLMGHPGPNHTTLSIDMVIVDKDNTDVPCNCGSVCTKRCSSYTAYKCSSFGGASGSPVMDLKLNKIILMHTYTDCNQQAGASNMDGFEYGVQLFEVLEDIYIKIQANQSIDLKREVYVHLFPQVVKYLE